MVDRSLFMKMLGDRFPEVAPTISDYEQEILHCEVAAFRRAAEKAMDEGHFWLVEQYFRFVETVLPDADAALTNALEISFIEDFALGEYTEQRHRAVRERVSNVLREKIVAINDHWK